MENIILTIVCVFAAISTVYSLECYTCIEQDSNRDKCIKTTKQCLQFQDACTTHIVWAVPYYWTPRGDRIYYISKDCDTRQGCERRKSAMQTHCKRDWYDDWACVECCTGDLCNYYVTLGSSAVKSSVMMVASVVIGVQVFFKLR